MFEATTGVDFSGMAQEQAETNLQVQEQNNALEEHNVPVEKAGEETAIEPSWYYDDQRPGEGDRPEYLLPKFKNLAEQAKSYKELEKRLGGFKGAPESYTYEGLEEVGFKVGDPSDPLLQNFVELGKKYNVDQTFFNEALKTFGSALKNYFPPDVKQIVEGAGPDGNAILNRVGNWGNNTLTTDEVQTLQSMVRSPEQLKLLDKIRAMTVKSAVPTPQQAKQFQPRARTMDEISNEILQNSEKYYKDPSYREKLRHEMEAIEGS